jgi:hypothetical protein
MQNHDQQHKIVDLPLFRPPDHHRTIWESLSKQQLAQLTRLMSKMLMEYQNLLKGHDNE